MKEEKNKKLDDLSKKIFKEAGLQSPDSNFEFMVMEQISKLPIPGSITVYKAPFSKLLLPIAALIFFGSILAVLFLDSSNSSGLLDKIPSVDWNNYQLPTIQFPKTVMLGMLALAVLLYAQVPMLKNVSKNS